MSDIKKVSTANACPRKLIMDVERRSFLTTTQLLDLTYVSPLLSVRASSIPIAHRTPINVTV
jgi:hypothetical protein